MKAHDRRKVLLVMGTRPEVIKLAPVLFELQSRPDRFVSIVCSTGQHRQMLDQAMATFRLKAHYDLDIMSPDQSLAQTTARAVERLSAVISREQPDVVLVQGDTTTAFCGALAAYYHHVRVGHVEAGLRTGDKYAPFPEEVNRRLVGRLADYHFAPTERAKSALLAEGVTAARVHVTGNTVIDALLWVREKVRQAPPDLPEGLEAALHGKKLVLVTGHRRESFGDAFENICHAIRKVADEFLEVAFVYPMHLNPNVRVPVNRILGNHERIHLLEPLSYGAFIRLMDRATVVLTDSGGVQEEAPSLGKPVLVMREMTERSEGIDAGNALLTGVTQDGIVSRLVSLLSNSEMASLMAARRNPYGDGKASIRIVDILEDVVGTDGESKTPLNC
ncbi:MAG: UDP-N-acetylglucosamine 2-epimerase (non-hydrolyzing) [Dehalococcoidales bacterium]|nr:UDP-N-acetylglucosamine 2-epimerase (non-hydrolyzing) [Dehalococcoidales bacterium]